MPDTHVVTTLIEVGATGLIMLIVWRVSMVMVKALKDFLEKVPTFVGKFLDNQAKAVTAIDKLNETARKIPQEVENKSGRRR